MKGWTRIKVRALARLMNGVPLRLQWHWRTSTKKNAPRLQMVSPRGVVWDFRLKGGAWMRRAKDDFEKKAAAA